MEVTQWDFYLPDKIEKINDFNDEIEKFDEEMQELKEQEKMVVRHFQWEQELELLVGKLLPV